MATSATVRDDPGRSPVVAGVDGCRGGWVAVMLDGGVTRVRSARTLGALLAAEPTVGTWGVDIPIGLRDDGWRRAEAEARRRLGRRAVTVFAVPPRPVVEASTYDEACTVCERLTGRRISRQAWALVPRIREVDALVGSLPDGVEVHEVHPEVSFAVLAGRPLASSKRSEEGLRVRREVLVAAGIRLPDERPGGPRPGDDDLLDAAAVAWTARRIARGVAESLPDPPEPLPDGRTAAIRA